MNDQDESGQASRGFGPIIGCTALLALVVVGGFFLFAKNKRPECLVEGTQVATPEGERPIEDLRVGDDVWCRTPAGNLVEGRVVWTRPGRAETTLVFELANGRALESTPNHPLGTRAGWVLASRVQRGDYLVTPEGSQEVRAVSTRTRSVAVYDLQIEPHANFVAEGVVVHNKSPLLPPSSLAREMARTLRAVDKAQLKYQAQNTPSGAFGDSAALEQASLFQGDHVTIAVSTDDPTRSWYATTSASLPGGQVFFVINQEGAVYFSKQGPLTPDPETCAIPAGVLPMSRVEELDR